MFIQTVTPLASRKEAELRLKLGFYRYIYSVHLFTAAYFYLMVLIDSVCTVVAYTECTLTQWNAYSIGRQAF